jgi:uncharacterized membrane protein YhaH (DUF805 family)
MRPRRIVWSDMTFGEAVRSGLTNAANFQGRASRPAFWWWWSVVLLLVVVFAPGLDLALGHDGIPTGTGLGTFGLISAVAFLGLLLPTVAVTVRRLHDLDRSGWEALWFILPVLGWIVLFSRLEALGSPEANRYGPPPPGAPARRTVERAGTRYVLHERPDSAPPERQ